jgi:hypothetical protein
MYSEASYRVIAIPSDDYNKTYYMKASVGAFTLTEDAHWAHSFKDFSSAGTAMESMTNVPEAVMRDMILCGNRPPELLAFMLQATSNGVHWSVRLITHYTFTDGVELPKPQGEI